VDFLRVRLPVRVVQRTLEAGLQEETPSWQSGERDARDMLCGGLTVADARSALRAIATGAGNELTSDEHGCTPFCVPWSSALMAVNFLAPFGSRAGLLGMRCGGLTFERELRVRGVVSRVGPTLDAVLDSAEATLAIEAKLAEPWRGVPGNEISRQYDAPAAHLSHGTRSVVEAIREQRLGYQHVDAPQLVKHLLGIHSAIERGELGSRTTLILLYWRPSGTGAYGAAFAHIEREFADFAERLADQPIALRAVGTDTLLAEWAGEDRPAWLQAHAAQLTLRYDRALPR
jgi:hypothetical protein